MTTPAKSDSLSLPPALIDAFATGTVYDSTGSKVPMHSNVSPQEALTLYQTVRELRPETSAEVGFAQGVSTLAILKALQDNGRGQHHVMDPFQEKFQDAGLAMVQKAGLKDRLQFHRKFAEEVFPTLPPLQFAFIDASHLFDLSLVEFVLADKKLEVGGVVAFHDLWMPSLQKLIRYILKNRSYELLDTNKSQPVYSLRKRIKSHIAKGLRMIPRSQNIFREELLHPWFSLDIPGMVFLRKTKSDARDWRYHQSF